MRAAPARIDALQQRLAALEAQLDRKPGEACPACGALAMRRTGLSPHPSAQLAMFGEKVENWACEACGAAEQRFTGSA